MGKEFLNISASLSVDAEFRLTGVIAVNNGKSV